MYAPRSAAATVVGASATGIAAKAVAPIAPIIPVMNSFLLTFPFFGRIGLGGPSHLHPHSGKVGAGEDFPRLDAF